MATLRPLCGSDINSTSSTLWSSYGTRGMHQLNEPPTKTTYYNFEHELFVLPAKWNYCSYAYDTLLALYYVNQSVKAGWRSAWRIHQPVAGRLKPACFRYLKCKPVNSARHDVRRPVLSTFARWRCQWFAQHSTAAEASHDGERALAVLFKLVFPRRDSSSPLGSIARLFHRNSEAFCHKQNSLMHSAAAFDDSGRRTTHTCYNLHFVVEILTTRDSAAAVVAKARYWSKIAILPRLGSPRRNIADYVRYRKTRMI